MYSVIPNALVRTMTMMMSNLLATALVTMSPCILSSIYQITSGISAEKTAYWIILIRGVSAYYKIYI